MKEQISAMAISGLMDAGFREEPSTGRFWYWTESPGIERIGEKWFPCDMLPNGEMQYSDGGYDCPVEAAKQALQFFK